MYTKNTCGRSVRADCGVRDLAHVRVESREAVCVGNTSSEAKKKHWKLRLESSSHQTASRKVRKIHPKVLNKFSKFTLVHVLMS